MARALSSSRRAPPMAASNWLSVSASSRVVVCSRLRMPPGPGSATRPWSIESCTLATSSRSPSRATCWSRYSMTSGKLWPVSTWRTGNGKPPGPEGLDGQVEQNGRVLAAAEQQDRPLAFGGHLPHDEDGVRLEEVEMVDDRAGGRGERRRNLGGEDLGRAHRRNSYFPDLPVMPGGPGRWEALPPEKSSTPPSTPLTSRILDRFGHVYFGSSEPTSQGTPNRAGKVRRTSTAPYK